MWNEKKYSKHGYGYVECPRCAGDGSDTMSPFSRVSCPKCEGNGSVMVENAREMEVATHRHQEENSERKNAWLFS
jgi:DnaJ-class molecular chaperone